MLGSKLLILYRNSEVDDRLGSEAEPDPETGRYKTNAATSRNDRSIDDHQPRKQCKDLFDAAKLAPSSYQDVIQNLPKYPVTTDLTRNHLHHLEELKLKLDKKGKETRERKRRCFITNQIS